MAMKNFSQIPLHKFASFSKIPLEILHQKLVQMNHNSFQLEMLKLCLPPENLRMFPDRLIKLFAQ